MVGEKTRVIQKTPTGEIIRLWDSLKEAGENLNINYQSITYACIKGILAGGYLWEYADKQVVDTPACNRHNAGNNMCNGKNTKKGRLCLKCRECEFYKGVIASNEKK